MTPRSGRESCRGWRFRLEGEHQRKPAKETAKSLKKQEVRAAWESFPRPRKIHIARQPWRLMRKIARGAARIGGTSQKIDTIAEKSGTRFPDDPATCVVQPARASILSSEIRQGQLYRGQPAITRSPTKAFCAPNMCARNRAIKQVTAPLSARTKRRVGPRGSGAFEELLGKALSPLPQMDELCRESGRKKLAFFTGR